MALILRYFIEFGNFRGCTALAAEGVVVEKFTFAISFPDEFLVYRRIATRIDRDSLMKFY